MSESIYNFLPKVQPIPIKNPLYKSNYKEKVKKDWKNSKSQNKTFGPIVIERKDQHHYLKCGQGLLKPVEPIKEEKIVLKGATFVGVQALPPLLERNHIKDNVELISQLHSKPEEEEKSFLTKKDYGKVPKYLLKRKLEPKPVKDDEKIPSDVIPSGYKLLNSVERQEMTVLLQSTLKSLTTDYGKLSLIIDTVPKKAKKVELESKIDEVESYLCELLGKKQVFIKLDE